MLPLAFVMALPNAAKGSEGLKGLNEKQRSRPALATSEAIAFVLGSLLEDEVYEQDWQYTAAHIQLACIALHKSSPTVLHRTRQL